MSTKAPQIIYHDNHLLVLRKPAGMPVQPDESSDESLLDWGKQWIKQEYEKPGAVFLGLVHRLDRPVSGVVVFGRTSKGAARLSEQFRTRSVRKIYWALVEGETPETGELVSRIEREPGRSSRIVEDESEGKAACLSYRRLGYKDGVSWLEIELGTGRHHQIRLQFADAGYPLLGDIRYGSKRPFGGQVALHARALEFIHPVKDERLRFEANPDSNWKRYLS